MLAAQAAMTGTGMPQGSRTSARTPLARAALDRGYGHAGVLGIVLFAFHGLISLFGGEDAFRDIWMAAWFVELFIGAGLLFGALTVYYAIRARCHGPLAVVAALAPLYALYALTNLGVAIPGTRWLMMNYAPGVAVSLLYAGLCIGVCCYWFVLGRQIDR
jgi:hypothetical protein